MLSTISEIFAPPRETPKKLPPARLIFWTTCLLSCMKGKKRPLNYFQYDYHFFPETWLMSLTGTSAKWSSKNPRKPCCIPTMFFTPYFSSVSTIYKSASKIKLTISVLLKRISEDIIIWWVSQLLFFCTGSQSSTCPVLFNSSTCRMTSLRPGQSPPQVTIPAFTYWGSKYICLRGPARCTLEKITFGYRSEKHCHNSTFEFVDNIYHHCSTQLQSGSMQSAPADVGEANLIT